MGGHLRVSVRMRGYPWFLDHIENRYTMKLQKYMFMMPRAVEWSSDKLGIRTLRTSEVFILYSIDYLPRSTYSSLIRHGESCSYPISLPTISSGLRSLVSMELIQNDGGVYVLTWKGRDFLSRVRRYLINVRL